jgi:hypothetical protein
MPTCKAIAGARSSVSDSGSPLLAGAAGVGLVVLIDGCGCSDARSEGLFESEGAGEVRLSGHYLLMKAIEITVNKQAV